MKDWQLPACSPEILRAPAGRDGRRSAAAHIIAFLHNTPGLVADGWRIAGVAGLTPARHLEFEHVHLQLQAAVDGLGVAIASLPLIEKDVAAGRLICPIAKPEWCCGEYLLVSEDRDESAATRSFRAWIMAAARRAYVREQPASRRRSALSAAVAAIARSGLD